MSYRFINNWCYNTAFSWACRSPFALRRRAFWWHGPSADAALALLTQGAQTVASAAGVAHGGVPPGLTIIWCSLLWPSVYGW
mgnify:CR=1 FL=1